MVIDKAYLLHNTEWNGRYKRWKENYPLNIPTEEVTHFDQYEIVDQLSSSIEKIRKYWKGGEYDVEKSLSLAYKHEYVYHQQVKNNYEYVLVMEDDVDWTYLPHNHNNYSYEELLNRYMKEFIELEGDVLVLGDYTGKRPDIGAITGRTDQEYTVYKPIPKDKMVGYDKSYGARCTHLYVQSLNASKKLLPHFYSSVEQGFDEYKEVVYHTTNTTLDNLYRKLNLKICHANPGFYQYVGVGN